jgi:hypothetical protein
MNIVTALCAGIAGAANGWAEVYVRGTMVRATVYGDFEASTSDSSGDNIDLDAYGAAEVYVNQLVDVIAKAPDGTVIRSWTEGYASPNVEVISPAFTGNDYVSGAAAVNEPTTLQAVLNLWETNAGAPDWKVEIAGVDTTLLNAFGTLAGLVYNVKSPVYGAVGDGVVNDQAGIQAALAAAVAAGGGIVFFPKGTYLISTAMAWDNRVAMMGVGQGVSIITTSSAANARMVTFTSGSAQASPVVISGLTFQSTQTNSGEIIYSSVTLNLLVEKCHLGGTVTSTGTLISLAGASTLRVANSRLTINSTAGTAIVNAVTARVIITGTLVVPANAAYTGSALKLTGSNTLSAVELDFSAVGTVPAYGIELQSADDDVRITGTTIFSTTSYPSYGLRLFQDAQVYAAGNQLAGFSGIYSIAGTGFLAPGSHLEMSGVSRVTGTGTSHTIPDSVSAATYRLTGTTPGVTMPKPYFIGQRLTIMVSNASGAPWGTIVFSGLQNWGTVATNPANGEVCFVECVATQLDSAILQWNSTSQKIGSA